ncbi:hypothetical protein GETHLI_30490 [Geothrix limicola]|uniref:Uncharacterized protein n=1 Tax=Geothrix limicola TaxID=2927978 RepID=A0ABQ5QIM1_9BACT|nr:hypothetical protein [Geothrix limicola]GLH74547.1 hypothetical protein GETHLI_30490 [Geothrix limicola]
MRMRTICQSFLPAASLVLLLACGGAATAPGPQAAPASSGFTYQDPSGSGWILQKNLASSDTHLILDVIGPVGTKGRGIGFNLQSDGTVAFAKLSAAGYVRDTGVFKLQSTFANYPVEPTLLAGGVKKNGTLLTVGIFQKDRYWPAQDLGQAVCQIAIDFDPAKTAALPPGTVIPLTITKAKAIPAFIGDMPADPTDPNADWNSVAYYYSASLVPVQISVGTLTTK